MTTRDHLIYALQEIYALHRDILPLLDRLHHQAIDERVRMALQTQLDGQRGELETTEQALNILGARFKLEHSVLGNGLTEASERFRRQMMPSLEQQELQALFSAHTAVHLIRGHYQNVMTLARAIGEADVAKLLEEMDSREVIGQADIGELIPQLVTEVNSREGRRAA